MMEHIEIVTTCPDESVAQRIGRTLVEAGLAACAQISAPITSVYRWKGAIETAQEYYLVLKAKQTDFQAIADVIQREHPYEVPEIIARPITHISDSYRSWLEGRE